MNIWTYVITHDSGSAPNFERPATTLAICKPRIREHAKEGDAVLAFNGAPLNRREPHSVRWAGVVSEVMPLADYWRSPRFKRKKPGFSRRPDNIYQPADDGELKQVRNCSHPPKEAKKDIGGKNVIVLRPSWHFGTVVAVLPTHFGLRMTAARRGQHKKQLSGVAWRALQHWLNTRTPKNVAPFLRSSHCGSKRRHHTPSGKIGRPPCA
jgi:Nucleotide modification associated domain 2